MTDVELAALTAVVNAEVSQRNGANKQREIQGYAMAYTDENWESLDLLTTELQRRGIIPRGPGATT